MHIELSARDQILSRYANQLSAIGTNGPVALRDALNREGDKGRTQIKRALIRQTGIKYSQIEKATRTIRASTSRLTYELRASGEETNLNLFAAKQGAEGASARPRNVRRLFPHTFIVGRYGAKVFKREGGARHPIRQVFGPNIAREIVKGESRHTFEAIAPRLTDQVGKMIARFLPD
ncbi:hypothetical protein ABEG18_03280 [Alsobacter sp. KACC 23698]|uniref:HK97 gp10 family phage protein n=1 Tax=Alsobacter sp. KACC 23698 TaxID=3149229 RepID=A0AAU7JHZ4_9HYPH